MLKAASRVSLSQSRASSSKTVLSAPATRYFRIRLLTTTGSQAASEIPGNSKVWDSVGMSDITIELL
jgi:hypothetical protein